MVPNASHRGQPLPSSVRVEPQLTQLVEFGVLAGPDLCEPVLDLVAQQSMSS
jgi:hypothetical protein